MSRKSKSIIMVDNEKERNGEEVTPSSDPEKPQQVAAIALPEQDVKKSVLIIAIGDEQKPNGAESKNETSDSLVVGEKENSATGNSRKEVKNVKLCLI